MHPSTKIKICAKCGERKPQSDFPVNAGSSDGRASYCRTCKNALGTDRRMKDPIARMRHYIVSRIQNELPKDMVPADCYTNLEKYLGYKLWELKKALKADLEQREQITLIESFKRGYHLDHKKPHKLFHVKKVESQEFKDCWAISNLWMISAQENLSKGSKYEGDAV